MNKIIKEDIEWTLKLYSLTLVLPIVFTIVIIFIGILGVETKFGFLMNLKIIWVDYYFTGSFLDIAAWKWHLCLLLLSFIINKINNLSP